MSFLINLCTMQKSQDEDITVLIPDFPLARAPSVLPPSKILLSSNLSPHIHMRKVGIEMSQPQNGMRHWHGFRGLLLS